MPRGGARTADLDFRLGVLWAAWWLQSGHGEDTYAKDLLIESVGRSGVASMQRLAAREEYRFRRGFWVGLRRRAS
jgi:hypothetical protein